MYVKSEFKRMRSIYAEAPVTTSAATTGAAAVIDTSGITPIRVSCITGPIYVSTLSTAPLTNNTYRLNSSGYIDIMTHNGYVALYSTSTGGTRQVLVYDY